MADIYLQFSTVLHVGSADNARAALAWLADESNPVGFEFPDERGFVATTDGCADGDIHLYAEHSGDPDNVLAFARKCGAEFRLPGKWGFAWAETCSRLRPGEFGGGAFVLHFADGSVDSLSLSGWLRACLDV